MSSQRSEIPMIDLRRIALYGPCRAPHPMGRLTNRPCSPRSYRDDVHFTACPQAPYSDSTVCMEWR